MGQPIWLAISELEASDESGNEIAVMGDEINVRMGSRWLNMRNASEWEGDGDCGSVWREGG